MKLLKNFVITSTVLALFLSPIAHADYFSDVSVGNKYYTSIEYLAEQGLINGYDDGTFRPFEEISRSEAAQMIAVAAGLITTQELNELPEPETMPFTDVEAGDWFVKILSYLKDEGIMEGYPDGSIKPTDRITLVAALKTYFETNNLKLLREQKLPEQFPQLESYPELLFSDTEPSAWYSKYVALASLREMLNVYSNYNINPDQEMLRGYLAEIIYRHIKSQEGYGFGKATFYGAAVDGHMTASGERFDMNAMTAAHKTLPFGTVVEVTNLANGKSVQVRITDRGPYGPGRVIDLSSGAFSEVAWLGTGVIYVQYSIVSTPQ